MKTTNLTGWRRGLCCVAFALPGCFFHRPAFYPAQVLIKDGAACFSVTNNREARKYPPELSFVSVGAVDGDKTNPVWSRIFLPDQPIMELLPHNCLLYGEGTRYTPKLRQGFRYQLNMSAIINGNNWRYRAYFCLYETSTGELKIHHAKWNNKINRRDWRICEK